MSYQDFDKFLCRYDVRLELVNETPLSIGSGKNVFGAVDNPIIRMGNKPFIPGSSLKGVLRVEAERFATSVLGEKICNILDPKDELDRKESKEKSNEEYVPCLICSVFGGPTIASHLTFTSAYLEKETTLSVVRHVSINRITGASSTRRLYELEQIEPGSKFLMSLQVDNIELLGNENENRRRIVLYSLSSLQNGLFIGGRKTIGNGLVKGTIAKVTRTTIENNRLLSKDVTQEISEQLVKGVV